LARVPAVLKALAQAHRREQGDIASIAGNNFFMVTVLLLQNAGTFIYLLIGLVLLFPLSTDPLRKIPASRLSLWPLSEHDRRILRLLSPWVNPISWLVAGAAVWAARGKVTLGLWGAFAGLFVITFVLSDLPIGPSRSIWLHVPRFPGRLGQLIRKNLREILSTLDFYCALLLSLCSIAWRLFGIAMPSEANFAISILIVLALSSYSQCLFGLDGPGGLARYRLLPLRGWEILLAKDIALLAILILLTLPLAPLTGLATALVALALGHQPTVGHFRPQRRWRFSTGAGVVTGLLHAIAMAMAASAVYFKTPWILLVCVAAWLVSLWYGGLAFERSDF
jgi:hypothetical protein